MEYNFSKIESYWRKFWADNNTFKSEDKSKKNKFYILDMFPYPSGSGLHVGHPLGYIASDIYARYKRNRGFNVLHPMGYDSFGLPAEQYAIQTGQHPSITTGNNINRYREQLDKMGFSFDWDREIRTSSPNYYRWTQWIFKQLFDSYYCNIHDKALPISELINELERNGNALVNSPCDEDTPLFTAEEWMEFSEEEQQLILLKYRLAYLSDTMVNWCEKLGTVLANDEVKEGVSERGGHPVEQKFMRQWSMRITAYADRLLNDIEKLDWSDSIKEIQRNWIGKSKGASLFFSVDRHDTQIEVFTTRPDTIFGVSFMVLAPEHELVKSITTKEQLSEVETYVQQTKLKSERDRQSNVKKVTGAFTGAYAIHPFTGKRLAIWIGDYVLGSYGTGAVMAVPCGDQRDWCFAQHFGIDIINIFDDVDVTKAAYEDKSAVIVNSDFLSGLSVNKAIQKAIEFIDEKGVGRSKTNYRLRDAIFSRQRYWGEPFPIFYKDGLPRLVEDDNLPITLPEVDEYMPTKEGDPPLARAEKSSWNYFKGDRMEYNTMPGWAGSSWYFLRYLDPNNDNQFVSRQKVGYWKNVDIYIGGAEHATGHLLYSRFWTKILYDLGHIPFDEPFQKMINQGMILGRSSFVYLIKDKNQYVSLSKKDNYDVIPIHVDISLVENDKLDVEGFKKWRPEFMNAEFIFEDDGTYQCGFEVEKMSKSKFNTQTPDELIEKYGADTLRMYEMFLGPIEQSKPWDTNGISGVHSFLKKVWKLFNVDEFGKVNLLNEEPKKENLKTLHQLIKKITEDIERFSFNTCVSAFMISVNELTNQKCNNRNILHDFLVLLSPYAPHICEELWVKLGNEPGSISFQNFPVFEQKNLVETNYSYPISFNGKMRFLLDLPVDISKKEIEETVLINEQTKKYLQDKKPKKIIIVPQKIVNIVF